MTQKLRAMRHIDFTYEVPTGVDPEALEESMIGALARIIGCDPDVPDHENACQASWFAVIGTIEDDD